MIIGFNMGHTLSGTGTGASGIMSETGKNREIGNEVIRLLRSKGHTVYNCTVDSSNSDLADIVALANKQALDVFVSLHLNAGGGRGTETYLYNGAFAGKEANRAIAKKVNDKVVASCNFVNRGVKEENFYVLRNTVAPAILIETCFVDSSEDAGKLNCANVAKAIAEALTGDSFNTVTPPTPSGEMYRVRLSWADAASQKGAFSSLENAITECKKYANYKVFNSNGTQVYPTSTPTPPPVPPTPPVASCDKEIKRYSEAGRCTITTPEGIIFRDNPCTCHGVRQDMYYYNESVIYDLVVITETYTWVSWIGAGNQRRYMPITQKSNGEKWATCV